MKGVMGVEWYKWDERARVGNRTFRNKVGYAQVVIAW